MDFDNEPIAFSRKDISRYVKLPKLLTPELAEIIGIIIGDGHLEFNKKYTKTTMYLLNISGSSSEDEDYYTNRINPIFFRLFNVKFNISKRRNDELVLNLYSKAITSFFKNLGISPGKKVDDVSIPKIILNAEKEIKKGFISGVMDTEGSISFKKDYFKKHSKPLISINAKSKKIITQLRKLLEEFNLKPSIYKEEYLDKRNNKISTRYRIDLAGKESLRKYLDTINFNNPRHITKINIWEKFGFCPPNLNYSQKNQILEGKLDPNGFY